MLAEPAANRQGVTGLAFLTLAGLLLWVKVPLKAVDPAQAALLHAQVQDYLAWRSKCAWTPLGGVTSNVGVSDAKKCSVQTTAPYGQWSEKWTFHRFGPFHTLPGEFIHIDGLYILKAQDPPEYVTSTMGTVLDAAGQPILSPEIHLHHNMLYFGTGLSKYLIDMQTFDRHDHHSKRNTEAKIIIKKQTNAP